MIRVGVVGAAGRMGREVCRAVEADPETALAAAVDLGDPRERLLDAGVDVVVDFTVLEASRETLAFAGVHGLHAVVGTTKDTEAPVAFGFVFLLCERNNKK